MSRTYDAVIFSGTAPAGDQRLTPTLFGSGGEACTGIGKLVQRIDIELLTDVGSDPHNPDRGTALLASLRSGSLRTESSVFVAFAFAAGKVVTWLARQERPEDPDDERLQSLVLDSVALSPGVAVLKISITSVAGTTRSYLRPITTLAGA
jgi:hypothetical protein